MLQPGRGHLLGIVQLLHILDLEHLLHKELVQCLNECCTSYHYFMLLQQLGYPSFELTTIITLEYLGIVESTNLVNVSDHISYVFYLFCFKRSGDFVSGSDTDSRENVLLLIPIQHTTGHVHQVKLMQIIRNHHIIMRSINTLGS